MLNPAWPFTLTLIEPPDPAEVDISISMIRAVFFKSFWILAMLALPVL